MEPAMTLSRRKTLALIGGGVIAAAAGAGAFAVTRQPRTAHLPWDRAGTYGDPRLDALSWALLAPNPHNRQPWVADVGTPDTVVLYADPARMLPHTDPLNRQITVGLGCFLDLMRMAAAEAGYRVEVTPFPEGASPLALDRRPVARAVFVADAGVTRDPLFAQALARRSLKEPYDTARPLPADAVAQIAALARPAGPFGGTVDTAEVAGWRDLTRAALRIEVETPHTFQESVDLFRIGHREVDANPDGIDFAGPLFETLRLTGQFSRAAAADPESFAFRSGLDAVFANTDTAMGHLWLVSPGNLRADQLAAGADWLRVNLACTALGIGFQPLSQALQEFPEMADLHAQVHDRLAPGGGTVQMLARIGYGPATGPSPRWPLETRLIGA
jgi:hypothetical protein